MMEYTDIHTHLLCHVDDGARDEDMMIAMLEMAWQTGTRLLCVTPHFGVRQLNGSDTLISDAYHQLCSYTAEHHPEMRVLLGNELRYREGCAAWLDAGRCKTLNWTDSVLVDFIASESRDTILNGLLALLNAGYRPILAHAERYPALKGDMDDFRFLIDKGVRIQVNADSIFGSWGLRAKHTARKLLMLRMASLVCSDAHDLEKRPPNIRDAFSWLEKHTSSEYTAYLTNQAKIAVGIKQQKS